MGEERRSDNCSSLATANAIGSGYQRTGVNRTQGANDLDRVVPLGDMSPKGTAIAPTPVGNRAEHYHELKIQGAAGRLAVKITDVITTPRQSPTARPSIIERFMTFFSTNGVSSTGHAMPQVRERQSRSGCCRQL